MHDLGRPVRQILSVNLNARHGPTGAQCDADGLASGQVTYIAALGVRRKKLVGERARDTAGMVVPRYAQQTGVGIGPLLDLAWEIAMTASAAEVSPPITQTGAARNAAGLVESGGDALDVPRDIQSPGHAPANGHRDVPGANLLLALGARVPHVGQPDAIGVRRKSHELETDIGAHAMFV